MNIEDIELKNIKGVIAREEAMRLYELARKASRISPCLEIGSYWRKDCLLHRHGVQRKWGHSLLH
ncbi:MAG: hypothetical protein JRD69_06160 [Deltaproteobacteria bacterium]|nr:hypothetical protein [Deltaproteobacteria bacterium]